MILNIPFVVTGITRDPEKYGVATAMLKRDDELAAGWLSITGPDVESLNIGDELSLRKGPCPDCGSPDRSKASGNVKSDAESSASHDGFGHLANVDTGLRLAQYLIIGYGRRQAKPSIISTSDPLVFDDLEFAEENEDNNVFYTRQNPKK